MHPGVFETRNFRHQHFVIKKFSLNKGKILPFKIEIIDIFLNKKNTGNIKKLSTVDYLKNLLYTLIKIFWFDNDIFLL